MSAEAYHKVSDLPQIIPVFPLLGALVFPRGSLPMNIFEPRYLSMIDDTLAGHRMIGMVQPLSDDKLKPALASVGCAGRLTSYTETDDGRYLVSLSGICRFTIGEECVVTSPYRQVRPDWSVYAADLIDPGAHAAPDRTLLLASLRRYSTVNSLEVDWDAVATAPLETLINALSAGCPFEAIEKQALLEALTVTDRAATLKALLDMDVPGDDTSTLQ